MALRRIERNRSAIELNELPAWDDAETLDHLALQLTAADTRSLAYAAESSADRRRSAAARASLAG
ncbi:MAG TPA: hypothetical protein VEX18_02080 [Polyangiaceae bacterium]|nr:hypothetical protein [Polyangiaceae bacterium]